jgi:hypothetical protein
MPLVTYSFTLFPSLFLTYFVSLFVDINNLSLLIVITNKMQLSYGIYYSNTSIVQHASSVMSFIIRNLNCIWASGLQTLAASALGAVWVAFRALCRSSSGTSTVFEPLVYKRLRRPPLVLSEWDTQHQGRTPQAYVNQRLKYSWGSWWWAT